MKPNYATEHYAATGALVYTTKIIESVCMYGYAFHRAWRYQADIVGMGVGDSPQGLWAYLRSDPIWGQRSSRGQSALKCPMATKFGEKKP